MHAYDNKHTCNSVWLIVLPYTIRSSGPARFAAPSGDEVQRLLSVVVVKGEDVNPLVVLP